MHAAHKIFDFAQKTPDARAVVYDLEPIGFRAFHLMITAMRRRLEREGLAAGGVAVIWMHSILAGWIANIALRSMGLTTVAIRAADELAALTELDIVAVVMGAGEAGYDLDAGAAPGARRIVVGPQDWSAPDDGGPLEAPPPTRAGGHILLTSGTTGRPKMVLVDVEIEADTQGVGMEQYRSVDALTQFEPGAGLANVLNFGLWTAAGYVTPLSMWCEGSGTIIHQAEAPERSMGVPGMTHVLILPSFVPALLAAPETAFQKNDQIQALIVGGAISLALADRLKARLTRRVASALGSTETGAWSLTPLDTPEDLRWHRIHPSRVIEVVDEEHRPLPPGQLGQVRVRPENGLTGYLNDPEASAAFFRDGFFYSGDLGILDGKGRLALSGRVTDVLNLRGAKVAAGPLEAALQAALGIEGVCVMSEAAGEAGEQVHVVLETATPPDEGILRAAAKTHMAGFPNTFFHFVDTFPRNHMGKVERLKLKQRLLERGAG